LVKQHVVITEKIPKLCIIWMHGLGSDAQDMLGLAQALSLTQPTKHIALDAPIRPVTFNQSIPMRAWYDVVGFTVEDREDEEGIKASEASIHQVISQEIQAGFKSEQIILAGFSQGGAMALVAGLSSPYSIGGIISLSAYLPLANKIDMKLARQTPIFVASGDDDMVVLPLWTQQGVSHLKAQGYDCMQVRRYPMQHTVCNEEINDIVHWISTYVQASPKGDFS